MLMRRLEAPLDRRRKEIWDQVIRGQRALGPGIYGEVMGEVTVMSAVCVPVCVSAVQMANSVPEIFFTWSPSVRSFYRKLEDVQVYSAGQSQVT